MRYCKMYSRFQKQAVCVDSKKSVNHGEADMRSKSIF